MAKRRKKHIPHLSHLGEHHGIIELELKETNYAGGRRFWIQELNSKKIICHMGDGEFGTRYAHLFTASPILLGALEMVLKQGVLDYRSEEIVVRAMRLAVPEW